MSEVVIGAVAIALLAIGSAMVFAQETPGATPSPAAQIERSEPSAKATKNPHAPHHHFDVRRPHKSTRPKIENPQTVPD